MQLSIVDEPGLVIHNADDFGLPTDPHKNVAGVALLSLMDTLDHPAGFKMTIQKRIKPEAALVQVPPVRQAL